LAVMHHLVIGRNIPFESIAKMCCSLGEYLIVEFVPKEDEKVRLMLEQKKDIYHDYSEENFISVFERYFSLSGKNQLSPSNRTLYLFKKNG